MKNRQIAVVAVACLISVALRLIESPLSNFSSMAALALFCGSVIRHPAAFLLPLMVRALTDVLLQMKTGYGFFVSWPFDYSAYVLIFVVGHYCVRAHRYTSVIAGGIAAVGVYFVISNFGVWLITGMYPLTLAGLAECFTMALPFARGTIAGNLIAAPLFFAIWNTFAVSASNPVKAVAHVATAPNDE